MEDCSQSCFAHWMSGRLKSLAAKSLLHHAGQVEMKRCGIPAHLPCAVQQWEGLIAVNYPARTAGVTRHMRAPEARVKCPELQCVHVETIGKAQCLPQLCLLAVVLRWTSDSAQRHRYCWMLM